jgi:DNA-binding PucR family transcriptional regulator
MAASTRWESPSPRVAALIRSIAERMLADPGQLFEDMDKAVLGASPALAGDAAMASATSASNRANIMRWATANVGRPGEPVHVDLPPEAVDFARDVVRRGIERELLTSYRQGQNAAWRHWMQLATTEPMQADELTAVLDVTSRSLFAFVDVTLAALEAQIRRERDELTGGALTRRRETVTLILEGAPIAEERAGARLGYDLARSHVAFVLWDEQLAPEPGDLERAATVVARAVGPGRPLLLPVGTKVLWGWAPGPQRVEPESLQAVVGDLPPTVRVAVGRAAERIAGFRRSHLEALATQRLAMRSPRPQRLTSYDEVELVALAGGDEEAVEAFIATTLGNLARDGPELCETLRVYLQEDASASRAARRLFTHRNTVLNRVRRAEELLPRPLAGRGLSVGLALELWHWFGSPMTPTVAGQIAHPQRR